MTSPNLTGSRCTVGMISDKSVVAKRADGMAGSQSLIYGDGDVIVVDTTKTDAIKE